MQSSPAGASPGLLALDLAVRALCLGGILRACDARLVTVQKTDWTRSPLARPTRSPLPVGKLPPESSAAGAEYAAQTKRSNGEVQGE
jgi:hypothetical protein